MQHATLQQPQQLDPKQAISQAQLAKEIGLHRSQISRYVRRGMPANEGGKVIRGEALAWIKSNVLSNDGGWTVRKAIAAETGSMQQKSRSMQQKSPGQKSVQQNPAIGESMQHAAQRPVLPGWLTPEERAQRELLERITAAGEGLPELAIRCGLKDINLAATLPHIWGDLVMHAIGEELSDRLYDLAADDCAPAAAEPDYEDLAKRYGLAEPKPKARERWLSKINPPLEEFCGSYGPPNR